ncbi:Alpha/Beta hydrolase protein [Apiospora arundinis]
MSQTLAALDSEAAPPLLKVLLPLSHRLDCFVKTWILKALARLAYEVHKFLYPPPNSIRPTLITYYPCRPSLQTRVFFPPTYESGRLLPVFLCIHGGGFAVGNPHQDDSICSMLAKRTGMLVVSLDYAKAPLHPFPAGVHDIGALADAVLADPSLPIDQSRVAIGGFSAGGNLALSASLLPNLKGRIRAAVPFYPIVDWSNPQDVKLARRPYTDGPRIRWKHRGIGSTGPTSRSPPWIYMIAAQWDMLRLESQEMIHSLAGLGAKDNQEEDFEEGTYKWTLAMGCKHGFTHHFWEKPEEKKSRQEKCEPIYQEVVEWLRKAMRD